MMMLSNLLTLNMLDQIFSRTRTLLLPLTKHKIEEQTGLSGKTMDFSENKENIYQHLAKYT